MERDPVCGMTVDPQQAAAKAEHAVTTYFFCCKSCAEKVSRGAREASSGCASARGLDNFVACARSSEERARERSPNVLAIRCTKFVPESNVFMPFELSLSEKQIPRFVGNVRS
jgi:YHS domain-containing protein